jgi:hypothetical protein
MAVNLCKHDFDLVGMRVTAEPSPFPVGVVFECVHCGNVDVFIGIYDTHFADMADFMDYCEGVNLVYEKWP